MNLAIEPVRKPRELHVRLTDDCRRRVLRVGKQLHLPASATVAMLVEEALRHRQQQEEIGPTNPEELQLHVLVGVEQLLALMESIHPKGPGIAAQYLPQAVAAAQARIIEPEPG